MLPERFFSQNTKISEALAAAQKAFDEKDYTLAERLYKETIELIESNLGADHMQNAMVLHNLSLVYRKQGRHEEFRTISNRISEIFLSQKAVLGSESLDRLFAEESATET